MQPVAFTFLKFFEVFFFGVFFYSFGGIAHKRREIIRGLVELRVS